MARPLTVNKSNYFIFGGQYAIVQDEFINNTFLGDERVKKLNSFVIQKITDKISKTKELKKYLWFLEQEINNAFLVGLTTYNLNFSLFEKALSKEGSLRAFIEFCKSLENSNNPQQDLIKHYQIEEPV